LIKLNASNPPLPPWVWRGVLNVWKLCYRPIWPGSLAFYI
jgi:hypothetical protein